MAGVQGLVSVSEQTAAAIAQIDAAVKPDFEAAFGSLRGFGTQIATETGWHGRDSEMWHDDFLAQVDGLQAGFAEQLTALERNARASYERIMAAGGNL